MLFLSLAAQPPSNSRGEETGPEKRVICPEPHSQEQKLTCKGSSLTLLGMGAQPTKAISSQELRQEQGGRHKQVVCLFPGTVPPVGLSDTCSSVHSSGRPAQADGHSCAKAAGLLGPCLQPKRPSLEGSWSCGWARKAYFWNSSLSCWGSWRRGPADFAGGSEGEW